jgi:SAM-dependent methyltransferase
MIKSAWYEDWFKSPYYPMLYAHRDEQEAEVFLQYLLDFLVPSKGAKIWDLACGNGRHSRYLAHKGFEVIGTDLSLPFIEYAQRYALPGQTFIRQDMRDAPPGNDFDYVLNLFTAFGYFDLPEDDLRVLEQIHCGLKPGGTLVLDYLNLATALERLVEYEEKTLNNVHFTLRRSIRNQRIHKEIEVRDGQFFHRYEESVKIIDFTDFQQLFTLAGFRIVHTWGNYHGEAFDPAHSQRLILFAEKI